MITFWAAQSFYIKIDMTWNSSEILPAKVGIIGW